MKEVIRCNVPSIQVLLWQTIKFFRKRKRTRNRLKWSQNAPWFASVFFFEQILGEVLGPYPPPPPPLRRDIPSWTHATASPRDWSLTPSGSGPSFWIRHWQWNVYFSAILLKLSLSEFKIHYLLSRLHHFASFFHNSTNGRGHPCCTLPFRPFGHPDTPPIGWVLDPPLESYTIIIILQKCLLAYQDHIKEKIIITCVVHIIITNIVRKPFKNWISKSPTKNCEHNERSPSREFS